MPREGPEYLLSAELRRCDAKEVEGILATLQRRVERIREQRPNTKPISRGDGGFATPELYDRLYAQYGRRGNGENRTREIQERCKPIG